MPTLTTSSSRSAIGERSTGRRRASQGRLSNWETLYGGEHALRDALLRPSPGACPAAWLAPSIRQTKMRSTPEKISDRSIQNRRQVISRSTPESVWRPPPATPEKHGDPADENHSDWSISPAEKKYADRDLGPGEGGRPADNDRHQPTSTIRSATRVRRYCFPHLHAYKA